MTCRLIESKPFEFVVGTEKKSFSVHAEAIGKQSNALNALINNRMKEGQSRSATFDDVDEATFIRFCQFAYTGDYAVPIFDVMVEEASITSEAEAASDRDTRSSRDSRDETIEEAAVSPDSPFKEIYVVAPDGWGGFRRIRTHSPETNPVKLPSTKIQLRQSFEDIEYPAPESQQQSVDECTPRPNKSREEDYTTVLLGHANLYVLAEKYGVDSLKALTLDKIHKTLLMFTLYHARIGDIVKLINCAYSPENTPDHEGRVDELRALVTHYVACEIDTIGESELFLSLLEEGGPFVRDFWMKVKERFM